MEIGNCLIMYDSRIACYNLYRILDIEGEVCEAWCYSIREDHVEWEMVKINLPLTQEFSYIPVAIHDKISQIIINTWDSIRGLLEGEPPLHKKFIEVGDCYLYKFEEAVYFNIGKIDNIDGYEISVNEYIVGDKYFEKVYSTFAGMDSLSFQVSNLCYDKVEKLMNMANIVLNSILKSLVNPKE